MTEPSEIIAAAVILATATVDELTATYHLCNSERIIDLAGSDLEDLLADLDHDTTLALACDLIDRLGRLRVSQGWASTEGEQPT